MLSNGGFIRWANENLVVLIAHNEMGHESEEATDSYGEAVEQCPLYPGMTCREHVNAAVDIDNARGEGLVKVPFIELCPNTWLVAPTGEVRQVSEQDQFVVAKIKKAVETLQEELGAPLSADAFAKGREIFLRADKALDDEAYGETLRHLARVAGLHGGPDPSMLDLSRSLRTLVQVRLDRVEEEVRWLYEDLTEADGPVDAARRDAMQKLLETVDVKVLDFHLPVRGEIRAWLETYPR